MWLPLFQIQNPLSQKPGLRFCTVPYSYTEVTLQKHYPQVSNYMRAFNKYNTTEEAIAAVKAGSVAEGHTRGYSTTPHLNKRVLD